MRYSGSGIRFYSVEELHFAANFTNGLYIRFDVSELKILSTDSPDIRIVLSNYIDAGGYSYGEQYLRENILYTKTTNNGKLSLSQSVTVKVDNWNIYGYGSKIVIYLPKTMTIATQMILVKAGDITLKNSNTIRVSIISNLAGNIDIDGAKTERLVMISAAGDADLDDSTIQTTVIRTLAGNFKAEDCSLGDTEITDEVGNIDLDSVTMSKGTFTCQAGNVDMKKTTIANDLKVTLSAGNFSCSEVAAKKLITSIAAGNFDAKDEAPMDISDVNVDVKAGRADIYVKNLSNAVVNCEMGSAETKVESFNVAGAWMNVTASMGSCEIRIKDGLQANMKVEASYELGNFDNSVKFGTEDKSGGKYTGQNGSGLNKIKLSVKMGNTQLSTY